MLNKIKREVDCEDGRLIGEDPSQLCAEAGGVDGREAVVSNHLLYTLSNNFCNGFPEWFVVVRCS